MKVRIIKAPKVKKYQSLTTAGQVEDAFYIPNSEDGQRNYVNAPIGLQPNAPGVGTVLQPGLMPDANNQMVNTNNVNDNITNEQNSTNNGLNGVVKEKGQSKAGKFLRNPLLPYYLDAGRSGITNILERYRKKDLAERAVKGFHMGQPLVAATQGTFGVNSMDNFTPGMLNTTYSTGDFAQAPNMSMAYGGQQMAYGGRVFNQIAPNALPDRTSKPQLQVSNTLQPEPRETSNIEAELGETLYRLNDGGLPAHYKIGGKPHSQGGTPLNADEDDFVFSKALKLKDKKLFPYFDISKPTSFSDVAKKYDINKFRKTLADVDSDKLQKDTAEKMIANYNLKLGMLALAQESTKGFPQGLPRIAEPFTIVNDIDPEMIMPQIPQEFDEMAMQQQMPNEEMMQQPIAKFGGSMKVRIKSLPRYQSDTTSASVVIPPTFEMVNGTVIDGATGAPVVPIVNTTTPVTTAASETANNFMIDLMEGNPEFWEGYTELFKQNKIKPELAIGFNDAKERQRKSTQEPIKGTKNVFGDRNIHQGELFEDFKKRQAWYFKDKPNWNYESIADVKDFQRKYCERAAKFGMKGCYFKETNPKTASGKTIEGTTFDGRYGEHTFNAPGFNEADPTTTPAPAPAPEQTPNPINTVPLDVPYDVARRSGYFPQDLLNIAAAAGQRIAVPETNYTTIQPRGIDTAFIVPDPSVIMEGANIATQGINAYGSRQGADASLANIQGKAARPAAEHILAVANANAGIYNNAQQFNSQVANQFAQINAEKADENFNTDALYRLAQINARNKKNADLARLINTATTNRATAETLSDAFSEHFYIDPTRGGHVTFFKGSPFLPNENADMSDLEALDRQLTKLKYSAEDKKDILKAALASKYATRSSKNSYLPDYSQFMYPFNAQPQS